MNREILFRAKSIQTGKWISGYYFEGEDSKPYIGYMTKKQYIPDIRDWDTVEYYENHPTYNWVLVKEEVVSETVGQYTGLTDKNGTKIFEGDIVKTDLRQRSIGTDTFTIEFVEGNYYLCHKRCTTWTLRSFIEEVVVIGNKHDNPELLDA